MTDGRDRQVDTETFGRVFCGTTPWMTSARDQRDAAIRRANDLIETIANIGGVRPLREIAEELTRSWTEAIRRSIR